MQLSQAHNLLILDASDPELRSSSAKVLGPRLGSGAGRAAGACAIWAWTALATAVTFT